MGIRGLDNLMPDETPFIGDATTRVNHAALVRTRYGWELIIHNEVTEISASISLDKKHLKDLFNAIGNEIGAF